MIRFIKPMTVRALGEDDWQALAELRLRALRECPGYFGSSLADEQDQPPELWKRWVNRNDRIIFGLFNGDKMIGFQGIATHKEDNATAEIWGSYILPDYRGCGYVALLYRACIDWAVSRPSFRRIIVSHREDNLVSKAAIKRFGFSVEYHENRRWNDGQTLDRLQYELDLTKLRCEKRQG